MLSRVKASYLAAAAALVLSGSAVSPTIAAPAQGNIQLAQNDEQRDRNRGNEMRRSPNREVNTNRSSGRESHPDRSSSREIRGPSRDGSSTRTVVRRDYSGDRSRVVVRDRDRDRDHRWRRHHGGSYGGSGFIVLGPRVVYRSYGAGWCRGLHRGRHWDRVHGWHAGRHYGPFRC